jgi:copper chaperone CopZ
MRFVSGAVLTLSVLNLGLGASAQEDTTQPPAEMPALRTAMPVPVQTEPSAASLDRSNGQLWHRATMTLSGSMCVTCLIKIERDISEIPGVAYMKVSRPSADAGDKPRTVSALVIFDAQSVKFDKLLAYLKKEKYKTSEVQDAEYK